MIELGGDGIGRAEYAGIVREHAPFVLATAAIERVTATRALVLAHIEEGAQAYGVTTGLGNLANVAVTPEDQRELQHSLLTARAAGLGSPLPAEVVRGAMLIRLVGFLQGAAGVTPGLCRFIAARLHDGWSPVVPDGPYGAAGEIGPLAHLFQTYVGEGSVAVGQTTIPAAEALSRAGIGPYEPQPKEGLALVNGSPFATALGIRLADRARNLVQVATRAAALGVAVTGSGARALSPRVGALTRDAFAESVQRDLAALLKDEDVWAEAPQPPVSARVIPQVHGAALRSLAGLETILESRLRGATDSPLYLGPADDGEAGLYPSGGFHALEVTLSLEALAGACCHLVNLVEKRLHRLLDARFSNLPAQLTDRPGVQAGVVALHKTVVGLAAEARLLAAPASIHTIDTSSGQEDVQAFTFLVATRLERLLEALETAIACELVALRQAAHLADGRPRGMLLRGLVDVLAAEVTVFDRDRTLSPDVVRVRALFETGALAP